MTTLNRITATDLGWRSGAESPSLSIKGTAINLIPMIAGNRSMIYPSSS